LGQISAQLNGFPKTSQSDTQQFSSKEEKATASGSQSNHHPALLSLLADELSITAEEIHDFEMYFHSPHFSATP
jgi:aspartyl aminopeptidase